MGLLARSRRKAQLLRELRAEAGAACKAAAGAGAAPAPQAADELPPCVRRYLDLSGAWDRSYTLVTARQVGQFKFDPEESTPWQTLDATQRATPHVPSFVWTTRCSFKPLVGMRGLDGRVGGCGRIDWRLWGWLPALVARGEPLDRSLLTRWLAEAPGMPAALAPSAFLRWEAVPGSPHQARAVVAHGGATASGVFTFGQEDGLLKSLRTDDYAMPKAAGGQEARPWLVRYSGHRAVPYTRAGSAAEGSTEGGSQAGTLFVPTESEAARLAADGRELPFVRFALQGLSLE